jgi:hypothetical protein
MESTKHDSTRIPKMQPVACGGVVVL